MAKQNDLMLNMLANPNFTVGDFASVGLDTTNTSLESEDTYKNAPIIQQNPIFQTNGQFDQNKFHQAYQTAQVAYNNLDKDDSTKIFSKYNIFAPMEKRDFSPQVEITTAPNPDRQMKSMIILGENSKPTKTPEEIAQGEKVYNRKTGEWEASPEDSFFDTLLDTFGGQARVLAAYDNDVDSNGVERGQAGFDENKIEHSKGELKINPDTGTYYYETLDGRNPRGKSLLHMSDIITREDSALNSIDFLDSDDMDKSKAGSFMKNAALVGSLFIPYVGTAITAATIVQQAANIGSVMGKLFLGSDNKAMNNLQALTDATNPMETRSQYAKEHTWSFENLVGMAADTITQLRQQRKLFEWLPAITKGTMGMDPKKQAAYQKKVLDDLNKEANIPLLEDGRINTNMLGITETGEKNLALMKAQSNRILANQAEAALRLEDYMKDYYKQGKLLSRAYMTLLTTNDMYEEAKDAGASDTDAMLLTLGYSAGEWALLSTDIGQWILPELRAERQKSKIMYHYLSKEVLKDMDIQAAKATTSEAKTVAARNLVNQGKNLAQKFINKLGIGAKKIGTADFEVGNVLDKGWKDIAKSTLAAGLAEGTEEVSEEVLADFNRAAFNWIESLHGNDKVKLNTGNKGERYLLNFLGGFMGGSVANVGVSYRTNQDLSNMNYDKAVQMMISMGRNGELQNFRNFVEKNGTGASKELSATQFTTDEDGNIVYAPGTKEDNQDQFTKRMVLDQIDMIQNTLADGDANISDENLMNMNARVMRSIRADQLMHTATAGRYIQEFNTLGVKLVGEINQINSLEAQIRANTTDSDSHPSEATEQLQRQIKQHKENYNNLKKTIQEYTDGTHAAELAASYLLETSPGLLSPFAGKSVLGLKGFAEMYYNKPYNSLTNEEVDEVNGIYQNYINTDKKDVIWSGGNNYIDISRRVGDKLVELTEKYRKVLDDPIINATMQIQAINFENLRPIMRQLSSDESWLQTMQNLVTANNETTLDDTSKAKLQHAIDSYNAHINGEAGFETYDTNTLKHDVQSILIDDVVGKALTDANRFLKPTGIEGIGDENALGFIPMSIKEDKISFISNLTQQLQDYKNEVIGSLEEQRDNTVNDVEYENLNNYIDQLDTDLDNKINLLKTAGEKLRDLPNSPLMQILDQFALDIYGSNPARVSGVIQKLHDQLSNNKNDITQFSLVGDNTKQELRETLVLLNMFRSVIEGARTDRMGYQFEDGEDRSDFWGGINDRINLIHKNTPKKEKRSDGTEIVDDWKDLPTIDGEVADILWTDLNSLYRQMQSLTTLFDINNGQKLNKQSRVSINMNYLLYKCYSKLCDVDLPDGWVGQDQLQSIRDSLTIMQRESSSPTPNLQLNPDNQLELQKERQQLQKAIHDFFQANIDKVKDVNELAKFLDPNKWKYGQNAELFTEGTQNLTDTQFIWFMAANAAINPDAWYTRYKEVLKENSIAPLAGQEYDAFLGVASILNGDIMSNFAKASRKALLDAFNNCANDDDRKAFLDSVGENEWYIQHPKLFINSDVITQFDNILFIEGTPGSGKTNAVDNLIIKYLQKYNPETLDNTWISHVTEDAANNLASTLGVEHATGFSRKSLLSKIVKNYVEPEINEQGDYVIKKDNVEITTDGRIIPKFEFNDDSNVPSVIFIDELSTYNTLDLYIIDQFAKKHGITVITTGDLDQTQNKGSLYIEGDSIVDVEGPSTEKINIRVDSKNFISTPKLGTSMRTANTQKNKNQKLAQEKVINPNGDLQLTYYQDDTKINGDKAYVLGRSRDKLLFGDSMDSILADIDLMLNDLGDGEVLNYVYSSTDSDLYKKLAATLDADGTTATYKGKKIKLWKGNSAQGQEGNYWIIEPAYSVTSTDSHGSPVIEDRNAKSYMQDIYTGITRAKKASLLIVPASVSGINFKESQRESDTQEETIGTEETINRYKNQYTNTLDQVYNDSSDIPYTHRTPDTTGPHISATTPPSGGTPPTGAGSSTTTPGGGSTTGGTTGTGSTTTTGGSTTGGGTSTTGGTTTGGGTTTTGGSTGGTTKTPEEIKAEEEKKKNEQIKNNQQASIKSINNLFKAYFGDDIKFEISSSGKRLVWEGDHPIVNEDFDLIKDLLEYEAYSSAPDGRIIVELDDEGNITNTVYITNSRTGEYYHLREDLGNFLTKYKERKRASMSLEQKKQDILDTLNNTVQSQLLDNSIIFNINSDPDSYQYVYDGTLPKPSKKWLSKHHIEPTGNVYEPDEKEGIIIEYDKDLKGLSDNIYLYFKGDDNKIHEYVVNSDDSPLTLFSDFNACIEADKVEHARLVRDAEFDIPNSGANIVYDDNTNVLSFVYSPNAPINGDNKYWIEQVTGKPDYNDSDVLSVDVKLDSNHKIQESWLTISDGTNQKQIKIRLGVDSTQDVQDFIDGYFNNYDDIFTGEELGNGDPGNKPYDYSVGNLGYDMQAVAYSHSSFALGGQFDEKGQWKCATPDTEQYRVDGVNGLVKLQSQRKLKVSNTKEYVDILTSIIEACKTIPSYTQLNNKINTILNSYGYRGNVKIAFGIVQTSSDEYLKTKPGFQRFYRDSSENLENNRGGTERLGQINMRTISVIIADGKKDILEIPILTLPNPRTILCKKEQGQYVFGELGKNFDSISKRDGLVQACKWFLHANIDHAQYKGIENLIKIFINTDAQYYPISNLRTRDGKINGSSWTPAGNLHYEGCQLFMQRGQDDVNQDFSQFTHPISLNEFAKDPNLHMSSIMSSTNGIIEDPSTHQQVQWVNRGHNFILYSDVSRFRSDDDYLKQYLKQVLDPNEPKLVQLAYVSTPEITVQNYLDSLVKFGQDPKNNRTQLLGNDRTAFLVLYGMYKMCKDNSQLDQFKQAVINGCGEKFDNLVQLLEHINSITDLTAQAQFLRKSNTLSEFSDADKGRSVVRNLQSLILRCLVEKGQNIADYSYDYNNPFIQVSSEYQRQLESEGKSLHYCRKLQSKANNTSVQDVSLVETDPDDQYKIPKESGIVQNRDFYIYGNLGSSTFRLNKDFYIKLGVLLGMARSRTVYNGVNNVNYGKGNAVRTTNGSYSTRISELASNLGVTLDVPPTKEGDDDTAIQLDLVKKIQLKYPNKIVFQYGNQVFVTNDISNYKINHASYTDNGKLISNQSDDGSISFTVQSDKGPLDVTIQNGKVQITQRPDVPQDVTTYIQGLTDSVSANIPAWIDVLQQVLGSNNPVLSHLMQVPADTAPLLLWINNNGLRPRLIKKILQKIPDARERLNTQLLEDERQIGCNNSIPVPNIQLI